MLLLTVLRLQHDVTQVEQWRAAVLSHVWSGSYQAHTGGNTHTQSHKKSWGNISCQCLAMNESIILQQTAILVPASFFSFSPATLCANVTLCIYQPPPPQKKKITALASPLFGENMGKINTMQPPAGSRLSQIPATNMKVNMIIQLGRLFLDSFILCWFSVCVCLKLK